MAATDLVALMRLIGERYQFTPEHYPELVQLVGEQRTAFAVKHSALHMMKSVGAIAAQGEAADHGDLMDIGALRIAIAKMLVNTLKLAEVLEIEPWVLGELVPEVMKSK
ncbi:MAG: hypothetical protein WCI89_00325 [bacterium]